MPSIPSCSTGTFMYQLMLRDEVALAEALAGALARGSSRRRRAGAWCGGRSGACSTPCEQAPPMVSWLPHSSATTVISALPSVAAQHRAGDEEDAPLGGDRVGGAVALGGVGGRVEEAVDGLVAAEVDDRELVAGGDHGRPGARAPGRARRARPHRRERCRGRGRRACRRRRRRAGRSARHPRDVRLSRRAHDPPCVAVVGGVQVGAFELRGRGPEASSGPVGSPRQASTSSVLAVYAGRGSSGCGTLARIAITGISTCSSTAVPGPGRALEAQRALAVDARRPGRRRCSAACRAGRARASAAASSCSSRPAGDGPCGEPSPYRSSFAASAVVPQRRRGAPRSRRRSPPAPAPGRRAADGPRRGTPATAPSPCRRRSAAPTAGRRCRAGGGRRRRPAMSVSRSVVPRASTLEA